MADHDQILGASSTKTITAKREGKLERRIREVERQLAELPTALQHIPYEFIEAIAALGEIAHYGHRQAQDAGYLDAPGPESKPPSHDARAYAQLRSEQAHMRERARMISHELGQLETAPSNPNGKAR